jgi:glycosyltransferase involved in cell wall biosynthesis
MEVKVNRMERMEALNELESKLDAVVMSVKNESETRVLLMQFRQLFLQVESQQNKWHEELMKLFANLQSTAETIGNDYQRLFEKLEDENDNRFEIIHQQAEALKAFKQSSLKHRLKMFLRPRIGILYQYNARPYVPPKHYIKPIRLTATPTVSIVTPSYNQGEFLERTILSVLGQQYPHLEYIIQDGGSKDESPNIIERHRSSLKHAESAPDKGQSNAINLGFQHATGEIMAYLNSDDILLPGALRYVVDYFNKHPDVDVVYGHRILIDEHGSEIGRWVMPPHDAEILKWADYVPQETLFWRKRLWDIVGANIDENYQFVMDWDLLLRFKKAGAIFKRLPRFLGAFRVHGKQKTTSQMSQMGMKEMERLRRHFHGRHVTHYEINRNQKKYLLKHMFFDKLYRLGLLRY